MNLRSPLGVAALALGLPLLGGCGPHYTFGDNMDFDFDFLDPLLDLEEVEAKLDGPYAEGSVFALWVLTLRDNEDLTGFDLVSLDPDVLRLDVDQSDLLTQVLRLATAVAEGDATIQLVDPDGDTLAETTIEVRRPDAIELHAAGPLFAGDPGMDTLAEEPTQLMGGLATYQVQYFADGERLAGNGLLDATSDDAEVEVAQTWFWERREWLAVRAPDTQGPFTVDLMLNGEEFGAQTFEALPGDLIDRVEIFGEPDRVRQKDEGMPEVLLAQSFAGPTPVFGVEYDWTVDGQGMVEIGDLLRYSVAPGESHDITASKGDLTAATTVEGTGFDVDSSNNVGCAHGAGVGAIAALGGLLARRRRRA